jgi:hypothetical protein
VVKFGYDLYGLVLYPCENAMFMKKMLVLGSLVSRNLFHDLDMLWWLGHA